MAWRSLLDLDDAKRPEGRAIAGRRHAQLDDAQLGVIGQAKPCIQLALAG